ncbi:MAG TPA: hypothetical protein VN442_00760 [Bryobacteraceae bacterium]|nr:hypothetical protein [Bryobacteraceae bacterium]
MMKTRLISSVFLLTLFVCLSPLVASDADALAISREIQAHHLIYGTILDPVFASPTSDTIVSYSRCGDSAIWTGHYLAAEAFRYKVTRSADALANARKAVAGIKSLLDVTGNNVLARCLIPDASPYVAAIHSEEAPNGVYRSGPGNTWIGGTSRDQYSGVMFGLGVAFEMFDDPELKSTIAATVTRIVDFLRGNDWLVRMPDGTISTTFLHRPDQQLAFLQLAREVNPNRFSTAYDISRVLLSSATIAPISLEVLDDDSYYKFNIDSINLYTLIHLERSSFGVIYRKAYDILRNHTDDHGNAFFNMIDRALNGTNPTRDAETKTLLEQWLLRSRRDVPVDLRGQVAACEAVDRACQPIPVAQRITTDYLWQRSPFQMVSGGEGLIETAGIDYILPYWMARYYGSVEDTLRAVSAASGAPVLAPEAIASLIGSEFASTTEEAGQPLPFSLGGVSLLVTDSAGFTRPSPIYYVSPEQINFLVPQGTAPGVAKIVLQKAGAADRTGSAEIRTVAPALFSANGTGKGVAAATAIRLVAGVQIPVPVFECGADGCAAVPIEIVTNAPVYLTLYGTGIRNGSSLANVTCRIGDVNVPVLYAGAQPAYAGLDQVNVALTFDRRISGEVDVVLTVDGQPSNPVRISLQ